MREPLEATPRAAMTTKRKLEVMIALGTCYLCGGKLGKVNEVEFDHIVPLDLGGEDTPGNILPAHAECHKQKTRNDIRMIAKSRRLRKQEATHSEAVALREPGQKRRAVGKIPSRPFSPVKRKFGR